MKISCKYLCFNIVCICFKFSCGG